jgi:hypothetical protein
MRERILEIIDHVTESHRKFKNFEEKTGISARRWQAVTQGVQRANDEMIEAIGVAFPQYAYWLVTGKTDEEHGHTSPILDRIRMDLQRVGRA